MGDRTYKPSVKLSNKLENDHYNSARNYFREHGTGKDTIDGVKSFFGEYENMKDQLLQDMRENDEDESYIKAAEEFTSERAFEIIDLAVEDHRNSSGKTMEWKRA